MGFDQCDHVTAGGEHAFGGGEDVLLPGPGDVDGDEVHFLREHGVHGVGALHDDDAGIFAELPVEGAVAGVDGVDFFGGLFARIRHAAEFDQVVVQQDVAGPRVAVAGLADAADVDHQLHV